MSQVDFVKAIKEALVARAGVGDLLASVTSSRVYLYEAVKGAALPLIIIWPFERRNEAAAGEYRLTRMEAEVNVYSSFADYDIAASYETGVELGVKAERALELNARLITASYASGVIMSGGRIQVETVEPFRAVVPGSAGQETLLCKLVVSGRVILRADAVDP